MNPVTNVPAYQYTFSYNYNGTPDPDNYFQVYLPQAVFPLQSGVDPDLTPYIPFTQVEARDAILLGDPDPWRVPEPTTIVASVILGLGGLMTKSKMKKLN